MILDDHIAIGEGTRMILEADLDCQADVFTDVHVALQHLTETQYDIYLIDFNLSDMDGLQFLELLHNVHPGAVAIIYTGYNIEKHLSGLLSKGISGFVSKTDNRKQLIDTVQYALEGKVIVSLSVLQRLFSDSMVTKSFTMLTERENRILTLIRSGLTNKAIAIELSLSQRTIEKDLSTIFSKLDVGSRAEAVIKWNELMNI